ncbi:hypothetical protein ABZ070_21630 [Streptomyces sp. NPDC006283]|uniref:hypothetical protein n=1 Tax=Streptomyces sp. NPDC006283 TaxID=3156741 RepID=UPI0033A8EF86
MNATSVGALLLCRAGPSAVRRPAHLLREEVLLVPAGREWSALVPEGRPWRDGGEHVDAVVGGWAAALAVGSSRPVLALWWDGDRAGFTLAVGFRRPVGYIWLADGTPVGEDEAMRTFAARLGLDPVLDLQDLEPLTTPDPDSDARARLIGLTAVLSRTGLELPAGLGPGDPADRLRSTARQADAEAVKSTGPPAQAATEQAAALAEGPPRRPWPYGPGARRAGAVQLGVGLPLVAWGARRRSAGWAVAGVVLVAHGALALTCGTPRPGA